ncbi:MAG: Do family serine endopeptidase [Muribaculaceae bacterium]|nr:Do family serine endopeptidase [Muribaculaceae bacterium]
MKKYSKLIAMAIVAAIIGSAFTIMATSVINSNNTYSDSIIAPESDNSSFIRTGQTRAENTDFTKAAEITVNAVVSIKSFVTPRQNTMQNFIDPFELFFGPNYGGNNQQRQKPKEEAKPQQSGLGSGVIISDNGYIVTNNHVIDGADKLEVTLNDNRTFNAKIIGVDSSTDLALIKIEVKGLTPIEFGNSDEIKVGEWVLAVGNPFGFTSTVTTGIVSAKARSISSATHTRPMGMESFIQTDAAVNPGNSGGALVNTNGQLIGINTAIYSNTGNYAGYSFAIPSSIVKKVITDIKQFGTVQRAVLGIAFSDLTHEIAKEKDITAVNDGIYIGKVEDRSAAMEAGLKEGDVITQINGNSVKNTGMLMEQMTKLRPGDKIKATYYRDNKQFTTTITLRNAQGNTSITKTKDMIDLGCAFKELSKAKMEEMQITKGIEVVGIKDGKFKQAGIKNGFVILEVNNIPISSRDEIEKIYNSIMTEGNNDKVMFIVGLYPTGKKVYYAVDLSE